MSKSISIDFIDSRLTTLVKCTTSGSGIRYETAVAKALLLNGGFVARDGRNYTIKAKNLGAGVYEVWAEEIKR